MTNIDNFKIFVKQNPTLISYVNDGTMTWQKFYNLYDLYGDDNDIWKDYLIRKKEEIKKTSKGSTTISNIFEMAKNLDANKIEEGITSIQKAISLFGDILLKDKTENISAYTPRPIYRRFDD